MERQGRAGSRLEIFLIFLKLGCISFGGPAAHLGYYREELIARLGWLDENELGEMIGLTQLLPGPSSSQTGFLIGISQGGILGGVAAWLGFTLPSAILMMLFAAGVRGAHGPLLDATLHGLQVAAIAVVAHAVYSMFRILCPDAPRAGIALTVSLFIAFIPGSLAQISAIFLGGLAGLLFLRPIQTSLDSRFSLPVSRMQASIAFGLFAAIFLSLELLAQKGPLLAFYQTGALVFGGGHVVLPLLEQAVVRPGWVTERDFLGGYGAAQAIPGPLFTFAAYLGFVSKVAPSGVAGGCLSVIAIFLPGLLLAIAAAPFWSALRRIPQARTALAGVNAAVVGLLLAALFHAARAGALRGLVDVVLIIAGLILLGRKLVSPVVVVVSIAAISAASAVIL